MTSNDAYDISLRYTGLVMRTVYAFIALSVGFVVWIVVSTELNETEAYADVRKMLALVFTIMSVSLMLATLRLMAKANAASDMARALFHGDAANEAVKDIRLFRPVSPMFALCGMLVAIIVVNYIILIYAVDGGFF